MFLYLAGPLSGGDIGKNCDDAVRVAGELWSMGHAVFCPHATGLAFNELPLSLDQWLDLDFQIIARCDGMVLMPKWQESEGSLREWHYAESLGMPRWIYPDIPKGHPTEIRCPLQVRAFAEMLGRMYRLHLEKNADYSPANILGTGEIGLVTRLWDKVARLMNLVGFRVSISGSTFETQLTPKHESIDDTLMDAAVYSIIGLLLRSGAWGR